MSVLILLQHNLFLNAIRLLINVSIKLLINVSLHLFIFLINIKHKKCVVYLTESFLKILFQSFLKICPCSIYDSKQCVMKLLMIIYLDDPLHTNDDILFYNEEFNKIIFIACKIHNSAADLDKSNLMMIIIF